MVIVTFIQQGHSEYPPRICGRAEAQLTVIGKKESDALVKFFSANAVEFNHIYTMGSRAAIATAVAISTGAKLVRPNLKYLTDNFVSEREALDQSLFRHLDEESANVMIIGEQQMIFRMLTFFTRNVPKLPASFTRQNGTSWTRMEISTVGAPPGPVDLNVNFTHIYKRDHIEDHEPSEDTTTINHDYEQRQPTEMLSTSVEFPSGL